MNIQQTRIAVSAPRPAGRSLDLEPFIARFQAWISEDQITDLVPIDVVDYRHLRDNPRVLLVAHHGVFALERLGAGDLRLSFTRKRDPVGPAADRLVVALREVARAVALLEAAEPRLRCDRHRIEVAVLSRLVADGPLAATALEAELRGLLPATSVVEMSGESPVSLVVEFEEELDLRLVLWGEPKEVARG